MKSKCDSPEKRLDYFATHREVLVTVLKVLVREDGMHTPNLSRKEFDAVAMLALVGSDAVYSYIRDMNNEADAIINDKL